MGFFDASSLPENKERESFFGSFNIPAPTPVPTPKKSLAQKGKEIGKAIVKDVYESAATIPVRATQAGASVVGAVTEDKNLKKKAFEYASGPVDIGFGVQVKPLDVSSVGRVAEQTAGDVLKAAALTNIGGKLTLAKQGALQSGVYAAGEGMVENKPLEETAKDVAVASVGGAVIGKAINKFFPRVTKEPVSEVVPEAPTTPTSNVIAPTQTAQRVEPVKPEAQPTPSEYAKYEDAITKDPIFVKGDITNQNIIDNYSKITKEVSTDELLDMVYGVNGKRLPNELPPSAVYNLLRADVSKLNPKQAERLLNKQPLSKAGFDLQAAKIKSGEIITNPIEFADMIETQLKEKVASAGVVTKKSIKKFLDDNECTLS